MPRLRLLSRLLLLVLVWSPACWAEGLSAEQAMSAYVLNFIKFVEWPYSADLKDGKLTLCVVGDDSLGAVLGQLDGRTVGERKLRVTRSLQYGDSLRACQVVVVGHDVRHKAAAIIKELDNAPVLTISTIEGFAEKGGCIGLLQREERMLFEINLEMLRRKKLLLPGQVLNLAVNVFGKLNP